MGMIWKKMTSEKILCMCSNAKILLLESVSVKLNKEIVIVICLCNEFVGQRLRALPFISFGG
ncbi:hypothetical protein SAMN05660648_00462 [Selenomonas ruminantium]|uniref:Uncharacterized protein n=1 Tax=Selenomonas ruminantium TaxID=971 RepID=A0A1H3VPT1_SELRU|nr:hypothetical protein SAMN05660648_00462 [Selenomonas ruminantium]